MRRTYCLKGASSLPGSSTPRTFLPARHSVGGVTGEVAKTAGRQQRDPERQQGVEPRAVPPESISGCCSFTAKVVTGGTSDPPPEIKT
ncbi:hypothetical protein E2C01_076705 [Portunus trituberculatus]|uniref:Uncharacterized protein n=1 Tax=Portunus trituberculatus TaxID=210409 RepID=A0A5B7ICB2_PORTR|nr:hypothetical protein [Portunus trituberculatus]